MKIRIWDSRVGKLLLFCLLVSSPAGIAYAESDAGRLSGTWDVLLTVRNCATGDALTTIRELATFDGAGAVVTSTTGFPPSTKTPGHGTWHREGGRKYSYSFKFFRFDTAGVLAGWTVIRQQAVLEHGGHGYAAEGGAEVYSTAGVLVATGCSTTTATRFE